MSAQSVAVQGHQKFRAGKVIVIPGTSNQILARAPRLLPRKVVRRIAKFYNHTKI
jgi:short-subunit dehydrogenase